MSMSLKNKVAIITGGSSGIGAAVALKFTAEGAKVAVVGRNENKLKTVSEMCSKAGAPPLVIVADLTNDNDLKRVISETIKMFGKLDVLVNNAGAGGVSSVVDDKAAQLLDDMLTVNLRPAVALTSLAAPHLIATKGNIINISSVASTAVLLGTGFAYSTAKAALDHYSRFAALELAREGVRVNIVNPGPVRTDFVKNTGVDDKAFEDHVFEAMRKGTGLKRISDPEEVAELVLFIASDKGRSITGVNYFIDNGVMLKSKM